MLPILLSGIVRIQIQFSDSKTHPNNQVTHLSFLMYFFIIIRVHSLKPHKLLLSDLMHQVFLWLQVTKAKQLKQTLNNLKRNVFTLVKEKFRESSVFNSHFFHVHDNCAFLISYLGCFFSVLALFAVTLSHMFGKTATNSFRPL